MKEKENKYNKKKTYKCCAPYIPSCNIRIHIYIDLYIYIYIHVHLDVYKKKKNIYVYISVFEEIDRDCVEERERRIRRVFTSVLCTPSTKLIGLA